MPACDLDSRHSASDVARTLGDGRGRWLGARTRSPMAARGHRGSCERRSSPRTLDRSLSRRRSAAQTAIERRRSAGSSVEVRGARLPSIASAAGAHRGIAATVVSIGGPALRDSRRCDLGGTARRVGPRRCRRPLDPERTRQWRASTSRLHRSSGDPAERHRGLVAASASSRPRPTRRSSGAG